MPSAEKDQVKQHLNKLDTHKPVDPEGTCPWVLRELADVNRRPPPTILERSCGSEEVLEDCKKAKVLFSRRRIQ